MLGSLLGSLGSPRRCGLQHTAIVLCANAVIQSEPRPQAPPHRIWRRAHAAAGPAAARLAPPLQAPRRAPRALRRLCSFLRGRTCPPAAGSLPPWALGAPPRCRWKCPGVGSCCSGGPRVCGRRRQGSRHAAQVARAVQPPQQGLKVCQGGARMAPAQQRLVLLQAACGKQGREQRSSEEGHGRTKLAAAPGWQSRHGRADLAGGKYAHGYELGAAPQL